MEETKVCTKCGLDLPLSAYGDRKGKARKPGDKHAECKKCTNVRLQLRYKNDPEYREKYKATSNRDYQKLRQEVLSAYGGKCSCCGETEPKFLTIDHTDNTGASHRKTIGSGAKVLCNFLKREGYPEGFDVLCFNCNCAKGFFGVCPHKTVDKQLITTLCA